MTPRRVDVVAPEHDAGGMADASGQAVETIRAAGKLNLTLRVVGRRPDGYHEIESLVVRIDLADEIELRDLPGGEVRVCCDWPDVPTDAQNLVYQAAAALRDRFGVRRGVEIVLRKRIPMGSGLGGGSADAAAVLRGLATRWGLGVSRAELSAMGAAIGSDVPLFLGGDVCVIRGRGELVEDWEVGLDAWAVLLLSGVHCSTPAVYRAWGASTPAEAGVGLTALRGRLGDVEWVNGVLFNQLAASAYGLYPALAVLGGEAEDRLGRRVHLTGSGSGLFSLYRTRDEAIAGLDRVSGLGVRGVVVRCGAGV